MCARKTGSHPGRQRAHPGLTGTHPTARHQINPLQRARAAREERDRRPAAEQAHGPGTGRTSLISFGRMISASTPSKPKRRRLKLKRLSKAMRSSVSLPSFKARHSYIAPQASGQPESPESVTSLRARQETGSSLALDQHIANLAGGHTALSPIPASPSEPASDLHLQLDAAVAASPASAPASQTVYAQPSAGTPHSGTPTGSFFKNLIPRARKLSAPAKPKATAAGRPPNLPLPPVPSTPAPVPPQGGEALLADQEAEIGPAVLDRLQAGIAAPEQDDLDMTIESAGLRWR